MPPRSTSPLDRAAAALEAEEPSTMTAIAAVLEAWRADRQPALADLVDRLSARRLEELAEAITAHGPATRGWRERKNEHERWRTGMATSIQAAWKLVGLPDQLKKDDPRVARAIFTVLFERDMFQGARARKRGFLESHAKRLAQIGDVRFVEPLRTTLQSANAFPGSAAEERGRTPYTTTLEALEAKHEALRPLDARTRSSIARIEALLPAEKAAPVKAAKKFVSSSAAEVLASVFASPDDDELRRVVGDRLLELDDPRGEFIALSFSAIDGTISAAGKKRMTSLFNRNAGNWSGAVAPIGTRDGMRFEKGFLAEVSLDKSTIGLKREMWDDALESPYWATVVQLNVSERCPDWWIRDFLQSPCAARLRRLSFRPRRAKTPSVLLERPEGSAPNAPFRLVSGKHHHPKFEKALPAMSLEQLRLLEKDSADAMSAVKAAIAKAVAQASSQGT
jgi:hypothetical protein